MLTFTLLLIVCVHVCICVLTLVAQSCPTRRSSVHRILLERIPEWVAIPFSQGSSWPRDQTPVSCVAGRFFTIWATREAPRVKGDCGITEQLGSLYEWEEGLRATWLWSFILSLQVWKLRLGAVWHGCWPARARTQGQVCGTPLCNLIQKNDTAKGPLLFPSGFLL